MCRTWFGDPPVLRARTRGGPQAAGLNVRQTGGFELSFWLYVDGDRRAALCFPRLGYSVRTSQEEGGTLLSRCCACGAGIALLVIAAASFFGSAQALQFEVYNLVPLSRVPSDVALMFPYIARLSR